LYNNGESIHDLPTENLVKPGNDLNRGSTTDVVDPVILAVPQSAS